MIGFGHQCAEVDLVREYAADKGILCAEAVEEAEQTVQRLPAVIGQVANDGLSPIAIAFGFKDDVGVRAGFIAEQIAVDLLLIGVARDPVPLAFGADDGHVLAEDEALVDVLEGLNALALLVHPHLIRTIVPGQIRRSDGLAHRAIAQLIAKFTVIFMREGIECGKDEAALSHIRKLLGKNRTDAALPPVFGEGGYIAHAAAEHDVAVEENVIDIVDHV